MPISRTVIENEAENYQKSIKIELQHLQNPIEKQLRSNSASETAVEPPFFRKILIFNGFLDPQKAPKSNKKARKFDAQTKHALEHDFCRFRVAAAFQNNPKNMSKPTRIRPST